MKILPLEIYTLSCNYLHFTVGYMGIRGNLFHLILCYANMLKTSVPLF